LEQPNPFGAAYSPGQKEIEKKDTAPYVPAPPKNPSFLQNALRRLSSSGPSSLGKMSGQGSVCERKVMNIDPNRDRAKVEDFDQSKLRRVSFCVDVEIAGFARYLEPEEEKTPSSPPGRRPSLLTLEKASNAKKAKETKLKDKAEGAALKNPLAALEKKEKKEADDFAWDAEKEEPADGEVLKKTKSPTEKKETKKRDDPFAWDAEKEEPGDGAASTRTISPTEKKEKKKKVDPFAWDAEKEEPGDGAALTRTKSPTEKKENKKKDPFAWDAEEEETGGSLPLTKTKSPVEKKKETKKADPFAWDAENDEEPTVKQPQTSRPKETENQAAEKVPLQTNGADVSKSEDKERTPNDIDGKTPTRKREKKKRTEEERKARKERKRRVAESSGKIPLELIRDESEWDSTPAATPPGASTPTSQKNLPTTDPLRIYRRCCQLRESPVLKKIADQISSPTATLVDAPSTVACLDLTNFPMAPADLTTLADWLAVVPVKKLILENCSLTDESVRIILAGVLAVKTSEQSKINRQIMKKARTQTETQEEKLGIIEKISLKNNDKIGPEGWKHIGLFIHLSRSLKSIDVSMIPFPPALPPEDHQHHHHHQPKKDICTIISKALGKRYGGNHLEELIMGGCKLGSKHVGQLIDGAIQCGLRRFGLAHNDIDEEGVEHIVRYLKSGLCEGLDLGGNAINDHLHLLGDCLDDKNPLFALSLAECGLTPSSLGKLMPKFVKLSNLRFIDLSHNRELFSRQPDALSMLRRYLPQLKPLKRIHLADVDLTPDHVIAICEVLPECSSLCHLSIFDNTRLAELAKGGDPASQEEACAMYASLMSAVRVSKTIIAVDVEVPGPESSEVVKAIARQVVAYSLRNMERGPWTDTYLGANAPIIDKEANKTLEVAPDILLQLVGHMDGYSDDHDKDPPAPDDDYVTAGTGVVKALGVCLGTAEYRSRDISPAGSGTVTPQHRLPKPDRSRKAREMSKNLLDSARKIKARLQPALTKEEHGGDEMSYRKSRNLSYPISPN
jgi:hypothetical protein